MSKKTKRVQNDSESDDEDNGKFNEKTKFSNYEKFSSTFDKSNDQKYLNMIETVVLLHSKKPETFDKFVYLLTYKKLPTAKYKILLEKFSIFNVNEDIVKYFVEQNPHESESTMRELVDELFMKDMAQSNSLKDNFVMSRQDFISKLNEFELDEPSLDLYMYCKNIDRLPYLQSAIHKANSSKNPKKELEKLIEKLSGKKGKK
jgi:hypothetical protein